MNKNCLLLTSPFRPNIGGVETHLDDLISEGTKKGVNFTVLTYQPLVTEARGKFKEKGKGFTIYRIPWIRMNLFLMLEKFPAFEFAYLFPGIFLGGFIYLFFNLKKIDVIHGQGLVAGAVGFFLAKIFRKKIIISTHSIYNFPKKSFYANFVKFIFSNSNSVLTLSKQSEKEVLSLGVPKDKVSVFTYWVDQQKFRFRGKVSSRKKLKLPLNKFICLFVGRLVSVKGINELMEAATMTKKDILFLIAGSGPMEDFVREVSAKHKNVIFLGPINNSNLPFYYSASDVLIVPSTHEEGFGRVIIEALSCSLPVIGSKRGAIPEAMNKKVGIFIDVSSGVIKKNLEQLKDEPNRLLGMRKFARKFAENRYSENNINLIIRHYDDKTKDVLIITSHFQPNIGGVETHLNDLVFALTKREWNVVIATYNPLAKNIRVKFFEKKKNLWVYRLPWPGFNIVHRLTPYPILEFLYLFPGLFLISLYALIKNPNVRILHAQGLVPAVVSLILAKITGKRAIVSTHNLYFFPEVGLYKEAAKFVLSNADCVLCLSEASLSEIAGIGVPKDKIRRFHYWLDLTIFKPLDKNVAKQKTKLSGKFVSLFVGRLIETKGVKLLLEASRVTREITYLFAGPGPLEEEIVKETKKNKNVRYLGSIAPASDQLRLYLSTADVVSAPSLVDEGYGRVAMEAIACGTCVLATKVGGLSEVVTDGVGWLVKPSPKEYINRLTSLKDNPKMLMKISKNTRAHALKYFSEENVDEIINAYQE